MGKLKTPTQQNLKTHGRRKCRDESPLQTFGEQQQNRYKADQYPVEAID